MRRKRLLTLAAVLTLLIALAIAAPITSGEGGGDQFTANLPDKAEPAYPNLGSQLNQLVAMTESGAFSDREAASTSPLHSEGSVAVTIHLSGNAGNVAGFLEDNGGDPRNVGEDYIEAYVPVSLLGQLSQQPGVTRIQEIIPPNQPTAP